MPSDPQGLLEALLGQGQIISLGGQPEPAWDYAGSRKYLTRMFAGEDGDSVAVQTLLTSLDVFEGYLQQQEEGEGKPVSQAIARSLRPFIDARREVCVNLEQLGAVREQGVCDALGNPLPEDRH
jgi:hypothetical protein